MLAAVAMPRASSAASALALARSDYPHGAHLAVVPATNSAADQYLAPVHRSTFERLHRLDGAGWLQFATWEFTTGAGSMAVKHQTVFGYGINLFRTKAQAARALADVKVPTGSYRVAHLPALAFHSADTDETLAFVFFAYKSVEVEAYYEYAGVAPAKIAAMLGHTFNRQLSHLAHLARLSTRAPSATSTATPPLPTDTAVPTATETPTPTPTAMPSSTPTTTPTATLVPTPTQTETPSATPTATSVQYVVQAAMASQAYSPGDHAVVKVNVTSGGQPQSGVLVHASFYFPSGGEQCDTHTDSGGNASCGVGVPPTQPGTRVNVTVEVVGQGGYTGFANTSFVVGS